MAINVGPYCLDVSNYPKFNKDNKCPICKGEANYRLTNLWHWMVGHYAKGMFRTCKDCGKTWYELLD
jgi:hypothetical protein